MPNTNYEYKSNKSPDLFTLQNHKDIISEEIQSHPNTSEILEYINRVEKAFQADLTILKQDLQKLIQD